MQAKITILGLVVVLSVGSTGCRTASKLAWWKTADNSATDATMMAHTAPDLPSDIAQQAAGLAATQPTPGGEKGGLAAPFVPQVSITPTSTPTSQVAAATPPAAYPSTSASTAHTTPYSPYSPYSPPYLPAPTTQVPATAQQATATTPGTTSNPVATYPVATSLPYNPDAMPAHMGSSPTAAASQGRYASTETAGSFAGPQGSPPAAAVAAAAPSGTSPATSSRYGQPAATSAANTPAPQRTEAAPMTAGAETATHFAGSRYQNYMPQPQTPPTQGAPTATEPAPAMQSSSSTVTLQSKPAAAMASTTPYRPEPYRPEPYRPGGTGTYPGQTAVEVATRPDAANESSPMAAPRYGLPTQSQPIQSQPTQGPRYR